MRKYCGVLALVGVCVMPLAVAAQTPEGEADELIPEQVLELEAALARLNFDPGLIDGVIDEQTRAAIRRYQDFAALPADSRATPALLAEVLAVARSFIDLRSTRSAEPAPRKNAEPAPRKSAEPAPRETAKTKFEQPTPPPPEPKPAEPTTAVLADGEPSAAPAPESTPAAEPAEPVKKPEAEAVAQAQSPPKPEPKPKPKPEPKPEPRLKPEPKSETALKPAPAPASGYNIGNVISRLAEPGKKVAKSSPEDSGTAPTPAPSGIPEKPPTQRVDGYAAFLMAYQAAQAGDFETAASRYGDAIDSRKLTLEHLGDAHFNRANALYLLGRYDQSIEDYDVAIGAKPTFAGAIYNRGFAYQSKGDQERALIDFRRARDLGLGRLGVRTPDRPPPLR